MKALTLTIESVDLPPVFPDAHDPGWGPNAYTETIMLPATAGGPTCSTTLLAADLEGDVAYARWVPTGPRARSIDPDTGEFSCTLTQADVDQVYTFDVQATDSDGQTDLRHVIMPVTTYLYADKLFADDNGWFTVDVGSLSNAIYLTAQCMTAETWPTGSNPVLHYTSPPHGTLSAGSGGHGLLYPERWLPRAGHVLLLVDVQPAGLLRAVEGHGLDESCGGRGSGGRGWT